MSRTHHVLFVVGAPGAGKTTALRTLASPAESRIEDNDVRWTLKPPLAFIGLYRGAGLDDSSNMGGDSVARHANRLSLEYWKRNILPDPQFRVTVIDGEMFLWDSHLKALRGDLSKEFAFIPEEQRKHYLPGGLYFRTYKAIMTSDETRFPIWRGSRSLPQVQISCLYLHVSPEVSLRRRRSREGGAGEGVTTNTDQHMVTAASKQRNFAQKFKEASEAAFFMPQENSSGYLEVNVEALSPMEVANTVRGYVQSLEA